MKTHRDQGTYPSNLIFIRHVKGPRRVTPPVEQGRARGKIRREATCAACATYLYRQLGAKDHALRKHSGVPPVANQRARRPCIFANLALESRNVRMAWHGMAGAS